MFSKIITRCFFVICPRCTDIYITSAFPINPALMSDIHKLQISQPFMFSCSPSAKELGALLKEILRSHMGLPFTKMFHQWKFFFYHTEGDLLLCITICTPAVTLSHFHQ